MRSEFVAHITIDNVTLGQGWPKIFAPIIGQTEEEILRTAEEARDAACDLVEWRIDHYEEDEVAGAVCKLSKAVKELIDKPLLITFRSYKEGGVLEIHEAQYFELYHETVENGTLDLLDIELCMPKVEVAALVEVSRSKVIKVVMCHYDFEKTPLKEEIIVRLKTNGRKGCGYL